jgi:hypothetical protein
MTVRKRSFPLGGSNIAVADRNIAVRDLDAAFRERGYCRLETESSGRRRKRFD